MPAHTYTQKLLAAPLTEAIAKLEKLSHNDKGALQPLEHQLMNLAQHTALLACYLAHRYNTGCGDQGHEASAKAAHRALVGVRKALGFCYPKQTSHRIP